MNDVFDYLVVGGGASGAALARSLAESTRATVALLEAGPSDEGRDEVLDLRRYKEVIDGPLGRHIAIEPPPAGHSRFSYPLSRVLGGCTSHNTCIWLRPPASDFEAWERAGATGWGPTGVAASFDALEKRVAVESPVAEAEPHRALLRAAMELGYPAVDFSWPFEEGVGHYRLNKRGNARQSASVVFLHPDSTPPANLAVFTNTEVERLECGAGDQVRGVLTNRGPFRARREVVLAAGALDTPRLLMHSGLGPPDQLRAFGIPIRQGLDGVGGHLLDHPACAVNVAAAYAPERQPDWNYAGILFGRIQPEAAWPDIEIQLAPELFEEQTFAAGYPRAGTGFNAYMTVNRARSEGRVRLVSADPQADLAVEPAYFSDPDGYDLSIMVGGVHLARRLFAAPSMRVWAGSELAPGARCRDEEEIASFVRGTATTGYHPAGTCRMGDRDDPRSVVGPDLKVIGVPGLRIADASIFPTMVSVNIAATCMMIGLRAAQLIAADFAGR